MMRHAVSRRGMSGLVSYALSGLVASGLVRSGRNAI